MLSKYESLCGGLEGIRTLDPHNANVVRSQLRYKPKSYNALYRCKTAKSRINTARMFKFKLRAVDFTLQTGLHRMLHRYKAEKHPGRV